MKYKRLYSDDTGESHVDAAEADFAMAVYAPPAPAFGVSAPTAVERYVMVQFPAGWDSDFHPTPRRQLLVVFSGQFEIGASDGSVLQLAPGGVLVMEDISGKGHSARVIGAEDVHGMMVHLA